VTELQRLLEPKRRGRRPDDHEPLRCLAIDAQGGPSREMAKLLDKTDQRWILDRAERLPTALEALSSGEFHIVLAHVRQPDGQVLNALQRMRQVAPETAVLVLTEFAPQAFAEQALGQGAQDVLQRSKLDASTLAHAIRYSIERQRIRGLYERELWSASILHMDYLSIVSNSADAILILNQGGVVEFLNPAAESMFGVRAAEAIGRPCPFGQVTSDSFEIEVPDREGRSRQAEVQSVETSWRGLDATLAVVRDITDRRALELQLGQAQKLESVGRLAAGIAHEINTPTQFITDNVKYLRGVFERFVPAVAAAESLLEAAKAGPLDEGALEELRTSVEAARLEDAREEVPEAFEDSLDGLKQVARIVGAMKVFAHPGSEEKTGVDLRQAIESTVAVARHEWRDVADVELDIEETLPTVPAMGGDLNQVILNLIVNASQAIEDRPNCTERGRIDIRAHRRGDWVEMCVSDNGVGIPDENRKHIFDPFFTTKEVGRGTGQGLSISRTIVVERHGGMLDVASKPGEGSTFTVRLPLTEEAALQGAA